MEDKKPGPIPADYKKRMEDILQKKSPLLPYSDDRLGIETEHQPTEK